MLIKEQIRSLNNALPEQVKLVAVSKTKANSLILEAYQAGQRDFGENYIQELVEKIDSLPKDINWHFIGHLQRNKVKFIIGKVHLIHGIDSERLLIEINKQAQKNNCIQDCLLQIYIAQEESKFGLAEDELDSIVTNYKNGDFPNIRICGLMGMASNTADSEQVAKEFANLTTVFKALATKLESDAFVWKSMGMSGDYELAIAAGGNLVRIGSTIFGSR